MDTKLQKKKKKNSGKARNSTTNKIVHINGYDFEVIDGLITGCYDDGKFIPRKDFNTYIKKLANNKTLHAKMFKERFQSLGGG